jgi:hypothetical protein
MPCALEAQVPYFHEMSGKVFFLPSGVLASRSDPRCPPPLACSFPGAPSLPVVWGDVRDSHQIRSLPLGYVICQLSF